MRLNIQNLRNMLQSLAFLLFISVCCGTGSVYATALSGLDFSVDGATTRIKLEFDGPIKYRTALLPDPYRIIIDMDKTDWRADARRPEASLGAVAGWRFGNYKPDTARLVLDLRQSATIASSFVQQDPLRGTVAVVFNVKAATRPEFLADAVKMKAVPAASLAPEKLLAAVVPKPETPKPEAPKVEAPKADTTAAAQAAQIKVPEGTEVKVMGEPVEEPLEKVLKKPDETPAEAAPEPAAPRYAGPIRTVVIDPGHGGVDPGTHGANGAWEKNVVLAIGKAIQRKLAATGRFKAVLTRDDDTFIPLRGRIDISRKHKADLFISVHADAIKSKNTRGATVYTVSERASDREAEMLARKENAVDLIAGLKVEASDPDVRDILIDLTKRETMNYSVRFAGLLIPELDKRVIVHKAGGGGHRSAGFVVLKATEIPSILLETGYLSNLEDSNMLASTDGQNKIADAVVKAVTQFFERDRPSQQDAR